MNDSIRLSISVATINLYLNTEKNQNFYFRYRKILDVFLIIENAFVIKQKTNPITLPIFAHNYIYREFNLLPRIIIF